MKGFGKGFRGFLTKEDFFIKNTEALAVFGVFALLAVSVFFK